MAPGVMSIFSKMKRKRGARHPPFWPAPVLGLFRGDLFGIGQGDDILGAGLMKNFLATLKEMGPDLWRIIFLNAGVKLCCRGSEVIDTLKELEAGGVSILVCGTCLDYFKLLEQKEVGETTNMLDVVTSLQVADKVITA